MHAYLDEASQDRVIAAVRGLRHDLLERPPGKSRGLAESCAASPSAPRFVDFWLKRGCYRQSRL